jgi:hypothetical protein
MDGSASWGPKSSFFNLFPNILDEIWQYEDKRVSWVLNVETCWDIVPPHGRVQSERFPVIELPGASHKAKTCAAENTGSSDRHEHNKRHVFGISKHRKTMNVQHPSTHSAWCQYSLSVFTHPINQCPHQGHQGLDFLSLYPRHFPASNHLWTDAWAACGLQAWWPSYTLNIL